MTYGYANNFDLAHKIIIPHLQCASSRTILCEFSRITRGPTLTQGGLRGQRRYMQRLPQARSRSPLKLLLEGTLHFRKR